MANSENHWYLRQLAACLLVPGQQTEMFHNRRPHMQFKKPICALAFSMQRREPDFKQVYTGEKNEKKYLKSQGKLSVRKWDHGNGIMKCNAIRLRKKYWKM